MLVQLFLANLAMSKFHQSDGDVTHSGSDVDHSSLDLIKILSAANKIFIIVKELRYIFRCSIRP